MKVDEEVEVEDGDEGKEEETVELENKTSSMSPIKVEEMKGEITLSVSFTSPTCSLPL